MIELTINGDKKQFPEGRTLLECLEAAGLKIPTLCHHKALTPYGACRLCLVEVEQKGRPASLQASCCYPALDGLVIRTDTERVIKTRKIMIELLLARCHTAPAIQKLAEDYGVHNSRLQEKNDDCIYCGACVRMCAERMGRSAVAITGRGPRRKVESPFAKYNPECWVCRACDSICPTGRSISTLTSATKPKPIPNAYNTNLSSRPAIYQMYPQMIPNAPIIDKNACVRLNYDGCGICDTICDANAIIYNDSDRQTELEVGAVILAPGYEVYEATKSGEFGYGRYPNVITSLEFERILSATGPYYGHILRPYDHHEPEKVAFIQCVGSRNTEHMYCSSVCCMYATKEAVIAKEHSPKLNCTIFYRDIRAFGKGYEEYYERAKHEGIRYIKASPSTVKQVPGSKNLIIQYSAKGGKIVEEEFDLVVLCVGIHSGPTKMLGELLALDLNEDGFIATNPLDPVKTNRDGIYVAGVASGPKDIPESVMESDAAASRCLNLLSEARNQLITTKEYPPERDVSGEEPKVGVFVCHCGTNIAGVVNVPSVVEYTKTLPNVVFAENNLYTCSADTCERIKNVIIEKGLNRLVVASCTPRTHEPLFMDTMRQAGLNPYLFEMANIRDQCSWVHMHQPEEATRKAKDLVRMAVAKVKMNASLYPQYVDVVKAALVIGGGVAGMTAALELAGQGFEVHLVEKENQLGGLARKIHFSPDGDIAGKLANLISAVENTPLIKLYLNSEVSSVEGSVPRFKSVIKTGDKQETIWHGVVIIATGAQEYKPKEYLYGENKNVLTQTEFEERLANGGVDGKDIVMIQCVGSREAPREYCSRVCCTKAIKNALKVKERNPEANVTILHKDIRTYGFYEKGYREAREKGVIFIRFDEEKPTVTPVNGRLNVSVKDQLLDMQIDLPADAVVLSTAIEAGEYNADLAKMLKVPITKHGFFLEAHMKLRPVDFATDGIFVCGTAHSPKNVPESILQAMAAATRAGVVLARDKMEIEPRISEPVDANCDGCAFCVEPCPYQAITLIEYMRNGSIKKTVDVDISLCHGCGTCMATCPKQGIFVRNFRLDQLEAVVNAALEAMN
ncbi:MAG: FAD-dependent oxidoreductase [candidate division KSB1 bacterium]|nr:FAD-dependent oxidoreductase [candidate division KSB1 bacterium]MDZ7314486.1 FAD-dependent oxidoreductase [candidate division KSB1 bacterium]